MHRRLRGTIVVPFACWLSAICLFGIFLSQPACAASGKARPGPLCLPVVALLGNPGPEDGTGPNDANGESSRSGGQSTATATPNTPPLQGSQVNHDVCVAAHVYQVIELPDGTRFLDVCPASVPDADCRFILLSLPADREEVGDLVRLGGANIQLRGTLRQIHGRFGIYISHARQLAGGPEKFRPNPRLLRDFDPESDRLAVNDPNLRSSGRRRSFMNRNLREPAKP